MALSISETGLALIKKFEGCVLTSYQDSAGVWTIGYGHTSGVKQGQTITQAQADAYLKADCATAETAVNKYYSTYKWNQNQFDALVSFAFNIGSIVQLTASGTRSISEISNKITAYNKAGGKVLSGLVSRRAAEKELFDTEVSEKASTASTGASSGTATVATSSKTASDAAAKKDTSLAGTYKVTASSLNVRNGAGTGKSVMVTIPKGTSVVCYGYYSVASGVKWLYVQFTYNNVRYTGFCSKAYLTK